MKYLKYFKKSAQRACFCTIAAIVLFSSCEKESGFTIDPITPVTADVKADKATTVGNLKENGYQITIPAGTFDEGVTITVAKSASQVESAYKSSKFERLGSPIDIQVDGRQETVWLNEMATVSFPLPKGFAVTSENNYHIYGSFYNPDTRTVEYISPDLFELQSGRITFPSMHFTDICPVLLKDTEACTKFARDRAAGSVADEKKKEETEKALGDAFREIYDGMGITDKSLQETLVRGALVDCDIASFGFAIYDGEIGTAAGALPEIAGAALLKHMKVSNMTEIALRTANPYIIQGVGNAVQQMYKGNYAEAGKAVVNAALDYFPPTRYLKIANELINYSVIAFYKSQQDEIFKYFQKTGKSVNDESDWSIAMTVQFQSLLRKIEGDVINSYCKINNIPRSSLLQNEINRLHSKAESDLRATLKDRIADETRIKKKQEEYLDVIRHFKEDDLLDRFAYGIDIDLRLTRLFNWQEKIVRMCGGPLRSDKYSSDSPEENLRYALKNYIALVMDVGNTKMIPGGELKFIDWLIEEGFIKEEKIDLDEMFGVYYGDFHYTETNTDYEGNTTNRTGTDTNKRIEFYYAGIGEMAISSAQGALWKAYGTYTAQGDGAVFTAKFQSKTEMQGSVYRNWTGEWNGTVRRVGNVYTMSGTMEISGTNPNPGMEKVHEKSVYTFTNFIQK